MNKGLGKLILIAGLGLGALYFLKSDSKKVSNSEFKKETKEHPSLDKETIVEDHKKEKYKNFQISTIRVPTKEKAEEIVKDFKENGFDAFYEPKKYENENLFDVYRSIDLIEKENKEEPKKVHRNKMTKEEFLAKMKAGREKKKMSKAEAGAIGGEATAELGKHKGHKTKKGLVQDQNKVSKEEHEKHYQKSKGVFRK